MELNEKRIERLKALDSAFHNALNICDPIEFQRRHQSLLYAISKVLLVNYEEYLLTTLEKDKDVMQDS